MAAYARKNTPAIGVPRRQHRPAKHGSPSHGPVLRNVTVSGRRTSLRLEPAFWSGLNEICAREGMILNQLCTVVDRRRGAMTLTQSVRVFVVSYFRSATPEVRTAAPTNHDRAPSPQLRNVLDAIT